MKQHTLRPWHKFLDLRLLLVAGVIALVATHQRPAHWQMPATALSHVGHWLAAVPRKPPEVALIGVERPELSLWGLRGPEADRHEQNLPAALNALAKDGKALGVVLPHPVDAFELDTGELLGLADGEKRPPLRRLLEQRTRTRELLSSGRVLLGINGGSSAGAAPLPVAAAGSTMSFEPRLPSSLKSWLWPLYELPDQHRFHTSSLPYYPVLTRPGPEQPLVYQEQGQTYSGFALALIKQARELQKGESGSALTWTPQTGVALGQGSPVAVSASGRVVPLVREYSTMSPSFARLSVEAATARSINSSIVLVGRHNDPVVERLAATLAALEEGLVLTEPRWFPLLNKLLLLVMLLFLLWVVPRLHWAAGAFVSVALAGLLVAAQLWTQLAHGWWTPVADLVWVLGSGFILMQVWYDKHSQRLEAQRRLELMSMAHATRLIESGELEQAQETLFGNARGKAAYNPYMTLAEAFASRSDYRRALEIVSVVETPKDKREELQKKRERWMELRAQQQDAGALQGKLLARTQVIERQRRSTLHVTGATAGQGGNAERRYFQSGRYLSPVAQRGAAVPRGQPGELDL